jgi:N-acetylneuraminate synthase
VTKTAGANFAIAGRPIGPDSYPYVIAEISANHRASKSAALDIVGAAAEAGADAVKLQHYTPETITVRSDRPEFKVKGGTIWDGRQLADLYAEAMTPWEWTSDIAAEATRLGVTWFSSPFDRTAVDFLAELEVPAFKIASFEIVDLPLIRYAASKGKPLIISTGMASMGEIDAAVRAAIEAGTGEVALLRCNSGYPADPAEMDLRAIPAMQQLWNLPVGFSDHSIGSTAAIASVALGACIIEKHLTLLRSDGGPDGAFSAEPAEFADLVGSVRDAHAALGAVRFGPSERELASIAYRRSLRAVLPIQAGERLTHDNVASVRPAGGLPPEQIGEVIGMSARVDIERGAPIAWTLLSSGDDGQQ